MNTNRDASQRTRYVKDQTLATFHKSATKDIQAGKSRLLPGRYADSSASVYTEVKVGNMNCSCTTTSEQGGVTGHILPNFSTNYAYFTNTGTSSWTAPTTCQNPVTYWIIGGGGGGGGAYDNGSGGGGGGGSVLTGTYSVEPGTSYTIVVGAGGVGGSGCTTASLLDGVNDTNGQDGGNSRFADIVATGGTGGLKSRSYNAGVQSSGGSLSQGGSGGRFSNYGGGGGGSAGNGGEGDAANAGTGGQGTLFVFPGIRDGDPFEYGVGGKGGKYGSIITGNYEVGASAASNTANGGEGGGSKSVNPTVQTVLGGSGGSGIVVIQFKA